MNGLLPLAHRGLWWPDPGAQNSLKAIADAFAAGYGVEVDVRQFRDDSSRMVLSHDPLPDGGEWADGDLGTLPAWDAFLDLARQASPDLPLLINVKEPGTEGKIAWDLQAWGFHTRAWLFDFELCGAHPLLAMAAAPGVRCLARVSDRAGTGLGLGTPALPHWAAGVWLDPWDFSEWATAELVAAWKTLGDVFVVAPDLHQRLFDFKLLERWREADGVCTDVPHLVGLVLAGDERVHPRDPWWRE